METETLNYISAISQFIAAVAAFFGLGFIGWQISEGRKRADLQVLQEFSRAAREHEGALLNAESEEKREQAFIEFLNYLELYAVALNDRLIPKLSRNFVAEKLRDSIAIIDGNDEWREKMVKAITGPETFVALSKFYNINKAEIESLRQKMAAQSDFVE